VKSLCGSGGFLYPCPERDAIPANPPVIFGPFGLPVSPEIADDMLPVYGPEEITPSTNPGQDDVPVWDVTGFSEFLTEYKSKRAAQDGVEPRGKASPRLWWILAAVAAFILWKS
jgi:hypothetical protein